MKLKFIDKFRILKEKEGYRIVIKNIEKDVSFHGTNLWILIFAILIASIGLNVNSTAVVIGAMLISPLMGPIVGVGTGVALNDLPLIRKAFGNYLFAAGIGLIASTIYFLISPLREAHSEILSRTQPTIYDVLISLFGGFAGIITTSSKQKGNVIAGVAIATALMPPLCTAGFGLATGQYNYFFGAFYLYLINSVFIAVAAIITINLLKYPKKEYSDPKAEKREKRIVWTIVICTLIPSLYLGYDIVQKNRFTEKANRFIIEEATFDNAYLLNKEIDTRRKKIILTVGGEELSTAKTNELKDKLKYYGLEKATIEIAQGFSILAQGRNDIQITEISPALIESEKERIRLKMKMDSINNQQILCDQIVQELKIQHHFLQEVFVIPQPIEMDSSKTTKPGFLIVLHAEKEIEEEEKDKINQWLKLRLNNNNILLDLVTLPSSIKKVED